jgi:hypothetical protein
MRRLVTVVAVLALVDVLLALGLWSTITVGTAPQSDTMSTAPQSDGQAAPSSAVQHLAELLAASAFRSVITNDYAPLDALIKRSAAWAEVAYVSVEDPQGRILGSTDLARVGQVWNDRIAADLRATARAPYHDVVVAILNPADNSQNAVMGRLRLGYRVEPSRGAAQPNRPNTPLWIVLGLAALAAVPTGLIVVKVATSKRPATTRRRSRGHGDEADSAHEVAPRTLTTRHGSEERTR